MAGRGAVTERPAEPGPAPETGRRSRTPAVVTAAMGAFGLLGVFVAEQDEPAKLWNLVVVLVATGATALTVWLAPRRWIAGAVAAVLLAVSGMALNPFYGSPEPGDGVRGQEISPSSAQNAAPGPGDEIRMHEIWPSSAQNVARPLNRRDWVATQFRVTGSWILSVEVAAGGEDARLLLAVVDERGTEIASGEADVRDWRAKVTFPVPVDVARYQGTRLYLRAHNLWPAAARVYFTRTDLDPGVGTYVRCERPRLTDCPDPEPRDLSAIVIGRR
ncbi:hypothetical protein [Actinoplanes campanulatus]|nr:hypothetical protein [Actinoplanes capillaceus]